MLSRIRTVRPPLAVLALIAAIFLAVGIGAFFVPAGADEGPAVLIKVETATPGAWELLCSLEAKLYFRGEDYAVVILDRESTRALDAKGQSWSEIAYDPRDSLFYVVYDGGQAPALPRDFTVLILDDDGALVAAQEAAAHDARLAGLKVMPLEGPRPVSKTDFIDLDFVHDGAVALDEYLHITRRVDPDSIGAFIQHLQDYGTRYVYTREATRAGQWLLKRLWGFGYPDTLLQPVHLDGKVSIAPGNVVATKPGSTVPEFHIVVGGHYDSIVSGGGAAKGAPGADDNASGTAATIEIARLLSGVDLDATVEFALFTAEEIGLLGSMEYVTQLDIAGIPTEKLFFINMDMIGNSASRPWRTRVYHDSRSEPLARLLAGVGLAYSTTTPVLFGPTGRSDHVPFWQYGYPALFIHEMDFSPVYHSINDRLEYLEMDYEAEVVKMVLGTVLHLANFVTPPQDVTAHQTESGDIQVEWTHSPDADLLGYKIEVIGGRGELIYETYTRDDFAVLDASILDEPATVRVRPEDVLGFGQASRGVLVDGGRGLVAGATPNPVTGGCRFDIFVPGSGGRVDAVVKVVDAMGREVAEIHDAPLERGSNSVRWEGTLPSGERVPAGVYFYVVKTGGGGETVGKIMVVR